MDVMLQTKKWNFWWLFCCNRFKNLSSQKFPKGRYAKNYIFFFFLFSLLCEHLRIFSIKITDKKKVPFLKVYYWSDVFCWFLTKTNIVLSEVLLTNFLWFLDELVVVFCSFFFFFWILHLFCIIRREAKILKK